ncbi:MAG: DinB family protein [Chloroflexi bacterium]|nr:DinB family protein [Chloroflexota bacterium]
MNANDVVMDYLDDNRRRLLRAMKNVSDDCLHWSPDGEANPIALVLWHMGRLLDVFATQLVLGQPAENERWFTQGWAEQTGYDPRGIGRDGWGSINDYTPEDVAAIPRFTREQLLAYHGQTVELVREVVTGQTIEELLDDAVGFNGRFSKYQVIGMALMDNVRHLGEIYALKAMWERQNKQEG